MPNFFTLLFMLYSKTAAYESYKFEREIQIQSNDLNSLAAITQEKLLGEHFQKANWVYLIRCLWFELWLNPLPTLCLFKIRLLMPDLLKNCKLQRVFEKT